MAVFGVGINDIGGTRTHNGKSCPYYTRWHSMLRRCYSSYTHERQPYYKNTIVCQEWLTYSKFKSWVEAQDWEGKELDKDILGDGTLYSPETCCFISKRLNSLFTERKSSKGQWPTGVTYDKRCKKFYAKFSCPIENREVHIGTYSNPDDAERAYKRRRIEAISALAKLEDKQTEKALLDFIKERHK